MKTLETDLLVIGAGSGGLSVAAGAVQMGAKVVLLEGAKMGGDCLNYGCVPSKALLASAKAAHAQANVAQYGVADVVPQVDYAAVMDHVTDTIATIEPADSQDRFEGLGVTVIREFGRFVSSREVQAGDQIIRARRIVIAAGSSPLVPPIEGLDDVPYLTNETLFDLREKPRHLLIIGGGPIGVEMAQAHRRLGCEVTVIEGAKALGKDDPDHSAVVLNQLRAEGVEIAEQAMAARVRGTAGAIEVECKNGAIFKGSHLLLAVGRVANTAGLDLEVAGIATHRKGITVDARLKTSNRRVYAIGDVTGGAQFTHVAGYQAGVVIRSALLGLPAKARTDHIPWVTYSDPELGQIGLTEAQAREKHGDRLTVTTFAMSHVDRAIAERKTNGQIKVMVVRGRPIGVSAVGSGAGEVINFWALVLANKMKMKDIAAMISPYPVMGEISKRAVGGYFSPKLFDNPVLKRGVRLVQKWLP